MNKEREKGRKDERQKERKTCSWKTERKILFKKFKNYSMLGFPPKLKIKQQNNINVLIEMLMLILINFGSKIVQKFNTCIGKVRLGYVR